MALEDGFWNAAVPNTSVVPMQMHAGERVRPTVHVGDRVSEGEVIGRGSSDAAPTVHAPIPGRITAIGTTRVASGHESEAVAIELDGEFERLGAARRSVDWRDMEPDELHAAIAAGGVVTTDRRTLPATMLYRHRRGTAAPVLVLDLAETEPYLSADAQIAIAYPREVLEGCMIVARLLTPRVVRALVRVHTRTLKAALGPHLDTTGVELRTADRSYPGNDRAQLEAHCLDRDDRTAEAGVVTIAPGTAHAIWEAVVLGKPQIERVVTIGGSAVQRPAHVRVRIGMSIADVLNETGGLHEMPARLVVGGVFTGHTVTNVRYPVTKATAAVLALTKADIVAGDEEPCIACGACARACPVGLDPMLLHRFVVQGDDTDTRRTALNLCLECGLCSHVCPARIPLTARFAVAKHQPKRVGV